jgi:hypothetical protein
VEVLVRKRILLVALLLVSLLAVGFARQSQPRVQWEYRTENFGQISDKKLNELAGQGWELVATAHVNEFNQFIFRRAK